MENKSELGIEVNVEIREETSIAEGVQEVSLPQKCGVVFLSINIAVQ